MTQGKRFGLSAAQKSDMWCRWKAGRSLHEIGRAFGKEHSSIRCLVSRHGGIVPAVRRRSLLALTLREREEISRGMPIDFWTFGVQSLVIRARMFAMRPFDLRLVGLCLVLAVGCYVSPLSNAFASQNESGEIEPGITTSHS
jgi:hypothetical protein